MLIFLDSSIICSAYKMKSPSFEVAQKVGTIALGEIVVDEVCNKYRENLEERASKAKKAIRDLNDLLIKYFTENKITNCTFTFVAWKNYILIVQKTRNSVVSKK